MQLSFVDTLFTLLLFLLLFISVFLFTSGHGKHISNTLIGCFFLTLCLNLTDSFLLLKGVYLRYPAWGLWGSNLLLIFGPLLFLYTQSVIYSDFRFTAKKAIHFVPFLLLFFVSEISYLASGHEAQIKILTQILARKLPSFIYVFSAVIYIHFLTYLFLSWRSIQKYQRAASGISSDAKRVTLGWLNTTIYFFLLLMLTGIINSYFSFQSMQQAYYLGLTITIFLLLLFIIFVLFQALRHPALFSVLEENVIDEATLNQKYAASPLQESEKKSTLDRIVKYMDTEKPYLQLELSLDELADKTGVKPKILSQLINEMLHQNFFEFINHYRIEEAKRLLTNPPDKKITVLEVLYQVGFNSKSSFNTFFKKETGITPGEFKKKNLN